MTAVGVPPPKEKKKDVPENVQEEVEEQPESPLKKRRRTGKAAKTAPSQPVDTGKGVRQEAGSAPFNIDVRPPPERRPMLQKIVRKPAGVPFQFVPASPSPFTPAEEEIDKKCMQEKFEHGLKEKQQEEERLKKEKAEEAARQAKAEKTEQLSLEKEKLEKEKAEKERLEKEKMEKAEQARLQKQKAEAEAKLKAEAAKKVISEQPSG